MDCNKDHVVLQTGEIVERRGECPDPTCGVGKHPGCWRTVSPAITAERNRYKKALEEIVAWQRTHQHIPIPDVVYIAKEALGAVRNET